VEVEKQPEDRGRYVYPEYYGKSRKEAVGYVPIPGEAGGSAADVN
jgi:hypothetical protein